MGPRCLDLSAGPFVQIGAGVAVAFLPDISIDIPAWEPFAEVLWKGPCVGYSGTVTYRVNEVRDWGSCTSEYCHIQSSTDQTMVKTLVPQMAHFGRFYDYTGAWGAPLAQPYTWTYQESSTLRWSGSNCYGFCSTYWECGNATTASGSGQVGWDADDPTRAWFVDGYDYPDYARAVSGISETVAGTERTTRSVMYDGESPVGAADDYCGAVGSERPVTPQPGWWESALEQEHPHFATMPSINLTLTGSERYHPEFTWSATVALTRIEFNR